MGEPLLELRNIEKSYEGQPLLKGVSFSAAAGETVCLLGRSGSGKSTLLRIIAGLEQAEAGSVLWQGQDLAGVPVHQRRFGLMFQDYALFPHQSVAENVAFGLRMQHTGGESLREQVAAALAQVNLTAFADRRVTELSGGEQQRVALARALAPRPRLLMLDEPLGALDRALRDELLDELRRLLHETGIPAIYVTHDQGEAFALADRLILLHDGRVEQADTPQAVYTHPRSAWVAGFFGLTNLIEGEVMDDHPLRVRTEAGVLMAGCSGELPAVGSRVTVLIRPTQSLEKGDGVSSPLTGRVKDVVFRGEGYAVVLAVGEMEMHFTLPDAPVVGDVITLWLNPDSVLVLGGAE